MRPEASRLLVDAALAVKTEVYLQPGITFLYPADGVVDEETPSTIEPGRTVTRWRRPF